MHGIGGMGNISSLASSIFSKIDTNNQGYITKSDLASALSSTSSSSSTSSGSSSVDELFNTLDSNGDNQVTKDEFTSGLQSLASQLDSQFNNMRMGQMPPPPPQDGSAPPPPPNGGDQAGNDPGFTKDQLTEMASSSSTDSNMASLFSTLASNFDAADADGNGKVDHNEAMTYMQSQQSASSTSSGSTDTSSTTAATSGSSSQDQVLAQLMALLRTYGAPESSTATSLISAVA